MHQLPAAIAAAIRASFGDAPVENVEPLGGGRSGATVIAFRIHGNDFVARHGTKPWGPRELACLRIASAEGVAPELRYVDEASGVTITERVSEPLEFGPALVPRIARTVRELHRGPAFPGGAPVRVMFRMLVDALAAMRLPPLPAGLVDEMDALCKVVARFEESAPCHHDLNPGNMVQRGDRVYLVDWEAAGQGDSYLDLGQIGVFAVPTPEGRAALLEAYLERPPTDVERARYVIGRVMALGFYAAAFHYVATQVATQSPGGGGPSEARPLSEIIGKMRDGIPPGIVSASFFAEMQRLARAPDHAAACDVVRARGCP